MDETITLVYERISSATYDYSLIGIIIPRNLWAKTLPSVPPNPKVEVFYLDPIYDENDKKRLKELKLRKDFFFLTP